jgi:hypothetical protein
LLHRRQKVGYETYPHYSTVDDLRNSAHNGCHLCSLVWTDPTMNKRSKLWAEKLDQDEKTDIMISIYSSWDLPFHFRLLVIRPPKAREV